MRNHTMDGTCKNQLKGHAFCLISVIVGGSAFISTKVLLGTFSPEEVVFLRFIFGYATLWLISPRFLRLKSRKDEVLCFLCGITGVGMYYWVQNVSLLYTSASNVSVIVSLAPMLTVLLVYLLDRSQKPAGWFVMGMILSLIGVVLVVSNGKMDFGGGMWGNFLAFLSALLWACYSVMVKRLGGYSMILVTRRIIFYGLLAMIPMMIYSGSRIRIEDVLQGPVIMNLLYLGCIGSAVANAIWNSAFHILGEVKANIYMYVMPVVTIICSFLFFKERITLVGLVGIIITIGGLVLAQKRGKKPGRVG